MAWRPTPYLIAGKLRNTDRRKVTGWIWLAGLDDKVTLDLNGEFHRDIRGAVLYFNGDRAILLDRNWMGVSTILPDFPTARAHMKRFALRQTGQAGNITAGRPPHDYGFSPYIEWYSEQNGRVVLEPKREQIVIIGSPIPACESDPISRVEQKRNMENFLHDASRNLWLPSESDDRPADSAEDEPEGQT